jgi:SAM-dependent methyltransferase
MGSGNGNNGRARSKPGTVVEDDTTGKGPLVPWFVPSLKATLTHHEKVKGSPLTQDEVERVRDEAPTVLVTAEMLAELVAERGYEDIDPDACWEQWQAVRATTQAKEASPDTTFAGSIPQVYDTYLVPLIFEPYAEDLVNRLRGRPLTRVLEIAAGTGVVTRALASALPSHVSLVATDLNPAMLERAAAVGTSRHVTWRQADAMRLPFRDGSFDAVVCQFGVMFFPDKPQAFTEARRVLAPGGLLAFSAWDRIEENEFPDTVTTALAPLFPDDPPRFMTRVPHGYHDMSIIARDLANGGFDASPAFETVAARSRAVSARIPAIAFCQGTPLRSEIEARDASRLGEATDAAEHALVHRFGPGAVDGKIQAHVVLVDR